jgi:hypothetical protein
MAETYNDPNGEPSVSDLVRDLSRVEAGTPPVPERAIDTTKEDVEHVKRTAKEARA